MGTTTKIKRPGGIRRYVGSESGNAFLGQLGFDVLISAGADEIIEAGLVTGGTSAFGAATTEDGTDAQCWICIQVNDTAGSCKVSVKSAIGDDYTEIVFSDGMKIYGVFTSIKLHDESDSGDKLICYRG